MKSITKKNYELIIAKQQIGFEIIILSICYVRTQTVIVTVIHTILVLSKL
jgi:hypothetical protein